MTAPRASRPGLQVAEWQRLRRPAADIAERESYASADATVPAVANLRGQLALRVALDARACETHTTYQWAAGGAVLTLSSTLPEAGLALELISSYVGQRNVATVATHLALGPVGHPPTISHDEHDHHELDPIEQPRRCVYDHAHQLLQTLSEHGWQAGVHVDELTFTALERVE